ncbi:MAG: alpha/beta fold hydrolase [Deltaproteobacteria bacterium]|nr:alpha/beta fold hydrolase [Deltaproteobacteria bacterium]
MENSLIFYPTSAIDATPKDVGLTYEDVYFTTDDKVKLNGWFIPFENGDRTLLWFHGNAGNISHRLQNIKLIHDKVKVNVFIIDYRGYGRSEGRISEEGTYRDATAAYFYLRMQKKIDAHRIVIFGRSVGAAIATHLAVQQDASALILETPFASIREMAKIVFPFLPLGPFLKTRYDILGQIKEVRQPVLVLHGDQDDIVPFEQGRKVFEAAPEPKEFFRIRGADHNNTFMVGGEAYFAALKGFIERTAAHSSHDPS